MDENMPQGPIPPIPPGWKPKKETVWINLPPKPTAAPTIHFPEGVISAAAPVAAESIQIPVMETFSNQFIEGKIKELLSSEEAKKKIKEIVADPKIEGVGNEINLITTISVKTSPITPSANVTVRATIGNMANTIGVKRINVEAKFDAVAKGVENAILPYLDKISGILKSYIEKERGRKVQALEICDGALTVTFETPEPAAAPIAEGTMTNELSPEERLVNKMRDKFQPLLFGRTEFDRGAIKIFDGNGTATKSIWPNEKGKGRHYAETYDETGIKLSKKPEILDDEGNLIEVIDNQEPEPAPESPTPAPAKEKPVWTPEKEQELAGIEKQIAELENVLEFLNKELASKIDNLSYWVKDGVVKHGDEDVVKRKRESIEELKLNPIIYLRQEKHDWEKRLEALSGYSEEEIGEAYSLRENFERDKKNLEVEIAKCQKMIDALETLKSKRGGSIKILWKNYQNKQ